MEIRKILKEFVDECSKKLKLSCILQFGSSTYLKSFKDTDLAFFSSEDVFPTEDIKKLFGIIHKFEKNYKDVVFTISTSTRERKAKYVISIVPLAKIDLKVRIDPFFMCEISVNTKVLFGKDPLINIKISPSKEEIIQLLDLEINRTLRKCLDLSTSKEAIRFLFKSTLRIMLGYKGKIATKKNELLEQFKGKYPKITIPKDAESILAGKFKKSYVEEVLKFAEICLLALTKEKE